MDGTHLCVSCGALLEAADGHDLCPSCLGVAHLTEGLSDNPCMNCSCLPRALRVARLAQLTSDTDAPPPSGHVGAPTRRSKRKGESSIAAPPKRRTRSDSALSSKVERLSAELAEMRSLFQSRQSDVDAVSEPTVSTPTMPTLPPEDDVLSLAASASQFFEEYGDDSERVSEAGSFSSARSSLSDLEDASMQSVLRLALERLGVAVPQPAEAAPESAFFRRERAPPAFTVPPSVEYLRELHACWRDPSALSRLSADGRALAAMHNAAEVGLERMPAVEPAIASLIVSPEEALRSTVRCPRPQCRVTDDILYRTYSAGARAGRIGNSLAHLMFALSGTLQEGTAPANSVNFSDAALQAFALLTRELGRMMSLLCQARRHLWLAQSPLTEASRKTLRSVPVVPGELFGPSAQEALERTIQASETRQQLSSLNRSMPPPARPRAPPPPRSRSSPRTRSPVDRYRQHVPQQRSDRGFRGPSYPPPGHQQPLERPRRPPRAPKGHGARR